MGVEGWERWECAEGCGRGGNVWDQPVDEQEAGVALLGCRHHSGDCSRPSLHAELNNRHSLGVVDVLLHRDAATGGEGWGRGSAEGDWVS